MAEITKQSVESLNAELGKLRDSLRSFRFGGAGSRSRNVREGRAIRKTIARVLTELNARNLPAGRRGIAQKGKNA